MFIKRTTRSYKGKTFVNHLLVESVSTPKGPRHRVLCSLGALAPAPREEWLALGRKIESSLGGQDELIGDARVKDIVARVRETKRDAALAPPRPSALVSIHTDRVTTEAHREAGPVHVGHQMWKRLDVDGVLAEAGLSPRARLLTEAMALNRLCSPASEHAMPDWMRRTALADILGADFDTLCDDALYRNLDRLHPHRAAIERGLAGRERTLFNLEGSIYLYDLSSTYFEGQCKINPQAKRGHSRDQRPDCKQVVVGLVLDRQGFPQAHEVFDGNRVDSTTVDAMLEVLEKRTGVKGGATVVVDRGMAYAPNLQQIKARGHHYIVASRPAELRPHLAEIEDDAGWQEIIRKPSPTNPAQKKSRVWIKRKVSGDEVHILCRSDGRTQKDRAIRDKHEARMLADLRRLQARINKNGRGALHHDAKIHEAIGRLRERYPRVARYYDIAFDLATRQFSWPAITEKRDVAVGLDGAYLLKTDRTDLSDDEVWRTYILLTRVEAAFRAMKSPLAERPIFHHLEKRVQTHIFLCVLAYHLLVSIEKTMTDAGVHTSWGTLREVLSTHQVATVVLPASNREILRIRRASTPEPAHREIYKTLRMPEDVMKPVKSWTTP